MAEGVVIVGDQPQLHDQVTEGFLGTGLSLGTEVTLVMMLIFLIYVGISFARYYGVRFNPLAAIADTLGLTSD
jgi:hypothetical protein